jgi:LysM repeat protein
MKETVPEKQHTETFMRASGKMNGLNYVLARRGDTFESLARELDVKPKKLAAQNEAPLDFTLRDGDYIYLEKKKKKAAKPYYSHQVKAGESMYIISQRYGIRLKNLYKMNHKEETFVPEVGEILKLR